VSAPKANVTNIASDFLIQIRALAPAAPYPCQRAEKWCSGDMLVHIYNYCKYPKYDIYESVGRSGCKSAQASLSAELAERLRLENEISRSIRETTRPGLRGCLPD
jgi:hypothetical protein